MSTQPLDYVPLAMSVARHVLTLPCAYSAPISTTSVHLHARNVLLAARCAVQIAPVLHAMMACILLEEENVFLVTLGWLLALLLLSRPVLMDIFFYPLSVLAVFLTAKPVLTS